MTSRSCLPVLLLCLLWPAGSAIAQTPPKDSGSVVTLSASAEREVANDEFSAVAGVERSDRSSAATQLAVNKVLEAVARAAKAAGLGFETGDYQSSRVEDPVKPGSPGVPPAHWVTHATMVIKSQDLEALGRFLGAVSSDVAIEQVSSNLQRDTRRSLTASLRGEAIREFQSKAREVAAGFGFATYEIGQVAVNDGSQQFTRFGVNALPRPRLAAAMAEAPALTLTQGRTTVTVTVDGSIRLIGDAPVR